MGYCTASEVEALVGFAATATTIPTTTQISTWIDQISAEIDTELAAQGVSTPVATPANAVLTLALYATCGVAALVEGAQYTQARPNESTRGAAWQKKYDAFLESIRTRSSVLINALLGQTQYSFPDAELADGFLL